MLRKIELMLYQIGLTSGVELVEKDLGAIGVPVGENIIYDNSPNPEYYGCGVGIKYDTNVWTGEGIT